MYNDGTISSRLRETQRELNHALARVNYVHDLLGQSYSKIRSLEEENASLKALLEAKSTEILLNEKIDSEEVISETESKKKKK